MGKSSMVIFHQPENNVNSLKCSLAGALETKNYLYFKSIYKFAKLRCLSSVVARTFTQVYCELRRKFEKLSLTS